ncbi:type II toxin-antitoxin system RelE/ParE family toxin [Caulobacter sp. BE254]|uniref:type II toxin-antitoxin system RelE/ParE family toxin n=1 Tax=unclassified Caulobacter TaxID=2648921 RepID=UPI002857A929|nr:type II toxin-antitoxin system RelE/ParE family toxin [Caulobacter sp. BE254]MDR7118966.1 addiction module RelE/StbE family toxin [Caulobacter sp. BE254]
MRRVIWTAEAIANLDSIFTYVAGFNAPAAARLAQRLQTAANSLVEHPERGRAASRGLRELATIHPYLIRYRFSDEAVVILRIRHGAQRPD